MRSLVLGQVVLAAALLAGGCQSQRDAYVVICNAGYQCEPCRPLGGPERATALATYIDENVTNADVRARLAAYAAMEPAARGPALLSDATAAGLASCPMANDWTALPPP